MSLIRLLVLVNLVLPLWLADGASTYQNPVVDNQCPDPGVIYNQATGSYYAVTTSGDSAKMFPIRESKDLATWKEVGHLFTPATRPSWSVSDYWAPEIHKVGSTFVAYFTARDHTGLLCVGAATAPHVTGPFKDIGHPLVRDPKVGSIDATFWSEGNATYLIWKEDANGLVPPKPHTPIWMQPLSANGITLEGKKFMILENTLAWEGPLVEGPWLIKRGGFYYLFYSANGYATDKYAVGVARASKATGPYSKKGPAILESNSAWKGPGHCSVVGIKGGSTDFAMVYHSWAAGKINGPGDERYMMLDSVYWQNNWPVINGSSPSIHREQIPH